MERREFMRTLGTAALSMGLGCSGTAAERPQRRPAAGRFVGVQIAPHSLVDEGIDHVLDLLQQRAAINAVMLNPYYFYGGMGRPLEMLADHGVLRVDNARRRLRMSWVRHDPAQFADTSLVIPEDAAHCAHAGREVFNEVLEPLRRRGMKLYVRLYEGFGTQRSLHIPNWNNVLCQDMYGRTVPLPCFNHPQFRRWWQSVVENLLQNYELDGIQFGFERATALHHVMNGNTTATCFCPYCQERARHGGIDPARAREGFVRLWELLERAEQEAAFNPGVGMFPAVIRLWADYPEIFAWDHQERESKEEIYGLLRGTAKALRPGIAFGLHLPDAVSRNLFTRAAEDYGRLAVHADFLKLINYHEIGGSRMARDFAKYSRRMFKGMPEEEVTRLMFRLCNYDPDEFPSFSTMAEKGLGPAYVRNEVRRCVGEVAGAAACYAGIGMDIPKGANWGNQPFRSDSAQLAEAVRWAVEAGAEGLVASREYEEISLESLTAFGDAVRSVGFG